MCRSVSVLLFLVISLTLTTALAQAPYGEERLRDDVMAELRAQLPESEVELTDDPLLLEVDGTSMGLGNLFAICSLPEVNEEACGEEIVRYVSVIVTSLSDADFGLEVTDLDRLRPQLMPSEYLQTQAIAHRPLNEDIVLALVEDFPDRYRYVLQEELVELGTTFEDALTIAIVNLDESIGDTDTMIIGEGTETLVVIETTDSYGAVRIMLPDIRQRATEFLGERFYAAFPNRDVVMMWRTDASVDLHSSIVDMLEESVRTQPYSLSDAVFSVTAEGVQGEEQSR